MVYSGIYLPNQSTLKSEQNSSNLNNTNTTSATNNVSASHLMKASKKLSSTGSTSHRSSESSRFNETSSNVTIKSELNGKFGKSPKLAPEIIFLIKEHAKTLETINQISKRLQEIELKVDDISQRLSRESSLNYGSKASSPKQNDHRTSDGQQPPNDDHYLKNDSHLHAKDQTRLPYSTVFKDVDHLSNNLSNNATNIPNNQILSDDSGGEYGTRNTDKTKTVSDDDELLSILDKITKCSHHILQTQQAYQQQGAAIYSSLSKPYAYNGLVSSSHQFGAGNQLNGLPTAGHPSGNLPSRPYPPDIYNSHQPAVYSNHPYLLNAKSPSIRAAINQTIQQPTIGQPLKYNGAAPQPMTASLNELLFEPNVERFLSNLDQLVCNDDTNLAAILGGNPQQASPQTATHLNPTPTLPMFNPHQSPQSQQPFIPVSPHHHQATSTPITSQPMLANNLRAGCLNTSNLQPPPPNLLNTTLNSSYNIMHQASIGHQPPYNQMGNQMGNQLGNHLGNNHISMQYDASPHNNIRQQYINWAKAKELLEKKERSRIDSQMKQADEWLGMVDQCLNRQRATSKYQADKSSSKSQQAANARGEKKASRTFD